MGDDASTDLRHDLVDDAHDMGVVDEPDIGALEPAASLDVDLVERVDHDLRDRVVAQERLERAVAEDVVGQLTDELAALFACERRAIERQLFGDRPIDALAEVLAVFLAEELGPELGDAGVVDPGLQLGVRVNLRRRGNGRRAMAVRGGKGCGASFPLAGETIVESHRLFNSSTS
jgi:hypothetical protein